MTQSAIMFNDLETGQETLRRMASVDRYNSWIYSRIGPHLGHRILEVGCGLGNMTSYFAGREFVLAVDRLWESAELVRETYRGMPKVAAVYGDICDAALLPRLKTYSPDTAVCINVLEHIEDDVLALTMMGRAVGQGGRLVVLAPAGEYLYGSLDIGLGHFRRYSLSTLANKMEAAGCRVTESFHMNVAGVPGWFLNSRVLRRRLLPRKMLGVFNLLVPVFDRIERALKPPFGLSVVVIGEVGGR